MFSLLLMSKMLLLLLSQMISLLTYRHNDDIIEWGVFVYVVVVFDFVVVVFEFVFLLLMMNLLA